MGNRKKLYTVIAETFGVDVDSITPKSSPDTIKSWDSLGMVNLITALEQAFCVSFNVLDVVDMHNIEIIQSILEDKGIDLR